MKTSNSAKSRLKKTPCQPTPILRFSPTAWAKLLFLRDQGDSEVGGFGITSANDLLLVEDVRLVRQTCSWAHVSFDDESVADFFDAQVDQGRRPEQFGRIWCHTHPGDCPLPSGVDEGTFASAFGNAQWAVMYILAQEGQTYARLRFNVGPGGDLEIPVEIDYSRPFAATDEDAWAAEYAENVQIAATEWPGRLASRNLLDPFGDGGDHFDAGFSFAPAAESTGSSLAADDDWFDTWDDYLEPFTDQDKERNAHESTDNAF